MTDAGLRPGDVVRLTLPARTEFVGVARSLAAGVASRLDLDLDHVEDVRLAVSEACAIVLPAATTDAELSLVLTVGHHGMSVEVSASTTIAHPPGADSFAWTVLRALAEHADGTVDDSRLTIRLEFASTPDEHPAGADLS